MKRQPKKCPRCKKANLEVIGETATIIMWQCPYCAVNIEEPIKH